MSDQDVDETPELGAGHQATVLMVDDSVFNIELVKGILEPRGYKVVWTRDSRMALKLAREVRPDLVISDMCMPGPDGLSVLAMIKSKEEFSDLPFILISARLWPAEQRRLARKLGATRFMTYPIAPDHLITEVERSLRKAPVSEAAFRLAHKG